MRLIDADKFKERLFYLLYELYNSHPFGELADDKKILVGEIIQHIDKMLNNTLTVETIPVEWINKYLSKYLYDEDGVKWEYDEIDDSYYTIKMMLDIWEKENELEK